MLTSLRKLWASLGQLRLHSAVPFGVTLPSRPLRCTAYLASTLAFFFAAWFAPSYLALLILIVGLWCLVAVYWTWTRNENQRGRIAKKIDPTNADTLPDLMDIALFTALLTPLYLLLLFERLQECFNLFQVTQTPNLANWFWFVLDKTYLRAFPDTVDLWVARVESIHSDIVDYYPGRPGWSGRIVVFLAWLLLYYILIQGIIRIWQIRRDINEGIAGVERDYQMPVCLGRRAVRPLLRAWGEARKPDSTVTPQTRANMAKALGRIGDHSAIPPLRDVAIDRQTPDLVREATLRALGELQCEESAQILASILRDTEDTATARAAAAAGLGTLTIPAATAPLLDKLRRIQVKSRKSMDRPNVRKELARAIGQHLAMRRTTPFPPSTEELDSAVTLLLGGEGKRSLLEDAYLRVRNKTAVALGQLGDGRAIEPLTTLLHDNDNPKLLQTGAVALGKLVGSLEASHAANSQVQHAVHKLMEMLEKAKNDSVKEAAVCALGWTRNLQVIDTLWPLFELAVRNDQEDLHQITAEALSRLNPDMQPRIDVLCQQVGREASQTRRLTVLNENESLENRIKAAEELGQYRDRRGTVALTKVINNAESPPELIEKCREALERLM
jgi:HEAT repeat protein